MPSTTNARQLHQESTVIDLHAHPSMKTYLGRAKLKKRQPAKKGFDLTRLRTSHPSLEAGGVDVLCSSVVVPEKDLQKDCWLIWVGRLFIRNLGRALSIQPDLIALEMIRHVEDEVREVNAASPNRPIAVVKSNQELEQALQQYKVALIHTLEGGHVLNGRVDNVQKFKAVGVCSITLAHFYENGVSPPVDAIPDDFLLKRFGCFRHRPDLSLGLPPLGAQVVEEMFDVGMIVDLTHSTPKARADVFALPNPRKRPIVMTHVGAHGVKHHPMNPTDPELRLIADSGGIVGVILYNHWLTDDGYKRSKTDDVRHVIRTVEHIVNEAGEDGVAFGSDYDGLTDPPDDLKEPADWPNLTAALLGAGYAEAQIRKFLGGNARRVLKDGWI